MAVAAPQGECRYGRGMVELVRRFWSRFKLSRGQCINCHRPLRDDAVKKTCGDVCEREWESKTAW